MPDVLSLRLLQRAAALGNISRAARELGLAPASASARLAELERSVGARLLLRTTRSVVPTQDGRAYLAHVDDALAALDAAQASLSSSSGGLRGTLRVSASASFGRQYIVPMLPRMTALHPQLKIALALSDRISDLVTEAADVAIRIVEQPEPHQIGRRLAPSTRAVWASPAYLERHGTPRTPAELEAHACLVLNGRRRWTFQRDGVRHDVGVQGPVHADHGEALRDAAIAGLGLTLQALWNVREPAADGRLVQVLTDYDVTPESSVWAVFPGRRTVSAKAQAFVGLLQELLGEQSVVA